VGPAAATAIGLERTLHDVEIPCRHEAVAEKP
jgi:hypothetical protein